MLEGWYCRSLANQEEGAIKDEPQQPDSDEEPSAPDLGRAQAAAREGLAASSSSGLGTALGANGVDYKERYKSLKKKLKFLIYENEHFQDLLHTNQRRLLKVSRDRTFLLDRLLLYEKPAKDSSDSDATDSSDSEPASTSGAPGSSQSFKEAVRRKHKEKGPPGTSGVPPHMATVGATRGRRRKILPGMLPSNHGMQNPPKRQLTATVSPSQQQQHQQHQQQHPQQQQQHPQQQQQHQQQHQQHQQQHQQQFQQHPLQLQPVPKPASPVLSTAEITRQLQERRPTPIELMIPECTSATVPTTMLSDESPSKCYPNETLQHLMGDDSPSHEVAAEECVPMEYTS